MGKGPAPSDSDRPGGGNRYVSREHCSNGKIHRRAGLARAIDRVNRVEQTCFTPVWEFGTVSAKGARQVDSMLRTLFSWSRHIDKRNQGFGLSY